MAELPLFPLNAVLFPGATLPLQIFEQRYLLMVRRCVDGELPFGVVLIRSGQEVGGPAEPYEIGATARIAHVQRAPGGRLHIVAIGVQRFRVQETRNDEPYLTGIVEMLRDEDEDAPGIADTVMRTAEMFREYTRLMLAINGEWTRHVGLPRRPGALADHIASRLDVEVHTRQRLLEELSVPRRLAVERRLLEGGIELLAERLEGVRRQKYGGFGVSN